MFNLTDATVQLRGRAAFRFFPPETSANAGQLRGQEMNAMPAARLVAAALCCACVCVAGVDLDDVMAALPETTRALLRKQNAEVMAMTDTICARTCLRPACRRPFLRHPFFRTLRQR